MDWQQFKQSPEGFKGLKGFKPPEPSPLKPLKPLKPAEAGLESHPHHQPDRPTGYLDRLAVEAETRADFCNIHRAMLGGTCDHLAKMDGCLLWLLIRCGEKIERAAPAEIIGGVTVGDVLRWVADPRDVDVIRTERRLVLTCADSMGTIH